MGNIIGVVGKVINKGWVAMQDNWSRRGDVGMSERGGVGWKMQRVGW
jgi:hypothetical protein